MESNAHFDIETGPITWIRLKDKRQLNLLSIPLIEALQTALEEISDRPDLKVLVLTGTGPKAFSAGADMSELTQLKNPQAYVEVGQELLRTLEGFCVPVIAAVNGYALGAGFSLALACDLRVVCPDSKMGQLAVRNGLIPPFGNLQRLIFAIGASRTRELTYTGRLLRGEELVHWGLSHHCVPTAELESFTRKLAEEIAEAPGYAVRMVKQIIDQTVEEGFAIGYARQEDALAHCLMREDSRQIMNGFLKQ